MTYDDFNVLVAEELEKNRQLRYGQLWFNLLSLHRPDLAHQISGTELDPFYKEIVSVQAHEEIRNSW